MAKLLTPLAPNVPIVDKEGNPNPYFQRIMQELTDARVSASLIDALGGDPDVDAFVMWDDSTGDLTFYSVNDLADLLNISELLDTIDDTHGAILYRDSASWQVLAPGTDGDVLTTHGVGADPTWETPSTGGASAPVMVQKASIRGDGTVTLPGAVTAGNWLVWIAAGHWNSIQGSNYLPSGFTRVASYNTSVNNGGFIAYRPIVGGTPNSYSVSASDNQSGVLYEFSGMQGIMAVGGGAVPFSGLNFTTPQVFQPPGGASIRLMFLEQDLAQVWSVTAETGLTVDHADTAGADNHKCAFLRCDGTWDGVAEGSVTTSVSDPVFGTFAIYG